jgi:hypothetical protein
MDAPDVEDFVACWMQPVIRAAVERELGDVLPYCTVERISGADDENQGTDEPVVQLDFYARGAEAAFAAARLGHRRMTRLFQDCPNVTLSDGSVAAIDFGETVVKPFRMTYSDDQIVRYTARYHLGTSYVTVA